MKKLVLIPVIATLIMISTIGFTVFIKYNQINELRSNITSISETENLKFVLDNSVENILIECGINKVHKDWIKKFINDELYKDDYSGSYNYLLTKLRNKNINLNIKNQEFIKKEMAVIGKESVLRRIFVSNSIREYREIKNNYLNSKIEEIFIGESLKIEDVKYF